jgi:ferric-dicitrate binding protein FerR (iron transport regulator)
VKDDRSIIALAARALSKQAERPRPAPADARASAIGAMAQAVRARHRRRRFRRGAGALALAATIALGISFGRGAFDHGVRTVAHVPPAASAMFVRGAPMVVRDGARTTLSNGHPLESGDRVVAPPGSRTTVALPNGTSVAVQDQSELVFASAGPHVVFELSSGAIHADVAKLQPNERFILRTGDAEVEVHGTSFDVLRVTPDPSCGNGTSTRVNVREGVVAVRAGGVETFVRANESWPVCAPQPIASESDTGAMAASRPVSGPKSTLAAENDLFEKAIGRKRAGDTSGAIAACDELLTRFPSSHLAQSAYGERMRLLRSVDKARAKAAARDYLRRYPNGFARKDAELVLAGD